MKKVTLLALVALTVSLASCGGDKAADTTATGTESTTAMAADTTILKDKPLYRLNTRPFSVRPPQ